MANTASAASLLFDLNVVDPSKGWVGSSLGTVKVDDEHGANSLYFDIDLAPNVAFQRDGAKNSLNEVFWFDLNLADGTGALTYNFVTPAGGAAGGGLTFSGGQYAANSYGQGFIQNFDYGLLTVDTDNTKTYYGGDLQFSITRAGLTLSDLAPQSITIGGKTQNVYLGGDFRQCIGSAACVTGPVGGTLKTTTTAVPEPATWALMIGGFAAVGSMVRRRRGAAALA